MESTEFDTTHARLRELLVETSPADAAGRLLSQGHAPLHVLHALVTETKPAVVTVLDELVRERASGPLPDAYQAYVALQTAKAEAPGHTIDRDGYAVAAAERAGHGREAMGLALPLVVDLPDPSVDRQAVANLLLVADPGPSVFERSSVPSFTVTTPLALSWVVDGSMPGAEPPQPAPAVRALLEAQLGALDADRHQVVVRRSDGETGYLAQGREGSFIVVSEPTYLNNGQVLAALPTLSALNETANLDLVSESRRHHYLVLEGLDARQAQDLDDRFGANLLMRIGDEHLAVVRLPEDPSRAQAAAILLRARYPDRPEDPAAPSSSTSGSSDRVVELMRTRSEALLPELPRERATADRGLEGPAEVLEQFAERRSVAFRTAVDAGFGLEPARLDALAARSLISDGYRVDQVAGAVSFAAPSGPDRTVNLDTYAKRVVETALNTPSPERTSTPDVGGR